jgi:hypothetical protein
MNSENHRAMGRAEGKAEVIAANLQLIKDKGEVPADSVLSDLFDQALNLAKDLRDMLPGIDL